MDLDRDGHKDIITGSWPSAIFVLRGTSNGFKYHEVVLGADGQPLYAGRASVAHAADWDGDGDLDLLVGNMKGAIYLFLNDGTPSKIAFKDKRRLTAGGGLIQAGSYAAPFVADWDGDGRQDLLSGSGIGNVYLYKNFAESGFPVLKEAEVLVDASHCEIRGRTKIAVADWNKDGQLDLVVGDFFFDPQVRNQWSEDEWDHYYAHWSKAGTLLSQWRRLSAAPWAEPRDRLPVLVDLQKELEEEVRRAEADEVPAPKPYSGYVWVLLRKPSL